MTFLCTYTHLETEQEVNRECDVDKKTGKADIANATFWSDELTGSQGQHRLGLTLSTGTQIRAGGVCIYNKHPAVVTVW